MERVAMQNFQLPAALALLLGLSAQAMASEAAPVKPVSEKTHVHKEGDGHTHHEKEGKDDDQKANETHETNATNETPIDNQNREGRTQ